MSLVIDCDRMFDGRRLIDRARVVVEEGWIRTVEGDEEPGGSSPADGERVSCRFLMPGLIDCHVHVTGYVEGSPAGVPFKPVKDFLRLLILNGVTTVRDTGNSIETIQYVREWSDKYRSARVVAAGPLLDVPPLVWPFSRIVRDGETARRQVDLLHLEGMDFIKAYRGVAPEVLEAIVAAADRHGMDVAADVGKATALEACRAGVRSLEHALNLFDERTLPEASGDLAPGIEGRLSFWSRVDLRSAGVSEMLDEFRARGTAVCPTLLVTHRLSDLDAMVSEPYLDYMVAVMPYHRHLKRLRGRFGRTIGRGIMNRYLPMPSPTAAAKAEMKAGLEKLREVTRLLHEAGVQLVAGTDAPNPSIVPGFSLHQEMALMVEAGLSPSAVLACATSAAAKLLRRDDLGHVRPGACADLLLLDGDPTADISETRNIRAVLKGGEWVDRDRVLERFKKSLAAGR